MPAPPSRSAVQLLARSAPQQFPCLPQCAYLLLSLASAPIVLPICPFSATAGAQRFQLGGKPCRTVGSFEALVLPARKQGVEGPALCLLVASPKNRAR